MRWWRDAVIYQIYPRSFADANGDGMGDLQGITSRLPHLTHLGVDAVWLSPFYRSPQVDGGYDVADYRAVDDMFGTLSDFDALLQRAHKLGLRVIIDLVPNHTSDEHDWFRAALASEPGSPERERYWFRTGKDAPPNNWLSIFHGSAWTCVKDLTGRDADGDQWYLHMFDTRQPDLNWTNPEVHAEFESILRFWLDRGVDGFRIDVAHGLVKDPALPDWAGAAAMVMGSTIEPTERDPDTPNSPFDHGPMFDQPGVHDIYRAWNRILAEYPGDRALVAEACVEPLERISDYVRPDEMQQAFNFSYLQAPWNAPKLRDIIDRSLRANTAVGAPTTWVLSNHDVVRHASLLGYPNMAKSPNGIGPRDPQPDAALGLRRSRAAALLTLALPGSAYLYQGEELGLPEHTTLADEHREDPSFERSHRTQPGRDGCRVPLPWKADAPGFGFGPTGNAWLPQPANWNTYAVDAQDGVADSTLELYRSALRLRRHHRLGGGELRWVTDLTGQTDDTIAFTNGEVLVIANLGTAAVEVPHRARMLLRSDGQHAETGVQPDTAVWLLLAHN
jgi:alpha-glucosidase